MYYRNIVFTCNYTPNLQCHFLSAYVYGSISLDVVHVGVGQAQFSTASLDRADDSRCDCVFKRKGAPHGNHELTLTHIRRLTKTQRWEGMLG